jgi:hypothetical protein
MEKFLGEYPESIPLFITYKNAEPLLRANTITAKDFLSLKPANSLSEERSRRKGGRRA